MPPPSARWRRPSPWIVRFAPLVAAGRARARPRLRPRPPRALLRGARRPTSWRSIATPPALAALAGDARRRDARARPRDGRHGRSPASASTRSSSSTTCTGRCFAHLLAALADDGVLLYETFARGNEAFGRPSNPDFLLAPGELLERVAARGSPSSRSSRAMSSTPRRAAPSSSGSPRSGRAARGRRRCRDRPAERSRPGAFEWGKIRPFRGYVSMLTGSLVAIATPMQPGRRARSSRARQADRLSRRERHRRHRHRRHHRRIADRRRRRALPADQSGGRAGARAAFRSSPEPAPIRRAKRSSSRRSPRRPAPRARCRSCRTTTSRRRKGSTGTSARSPKRSTCR